MINNTFSLSVVICTHNPRRDFLERTLDALRKQTSPLGEWELILIDNASSDPVKNRFDLSWHPCGRHVRENELGFTAVRIRGMKEAKAGLILYVDDDNLLAPDYIEKGLRKGEKWPMIGCWGGQLLPEFESEPPEWTRQWWSYLAIRPLERDVWSNLQHQFESLPPTAGMFIRHPVWERYLETIANDKRRSLLGTDGEKRIGGEDSDLAFSACDLGLGTARFVDLKLTHIIPPNRLTKEYLLKLVESISYSTTVLSHLRGAATPMRRKPLLDNVIEALRGCRLPKRTRQFYFAEIRGRRNALRDMTAFP